MKALLCNATGIVLAHNHPSLGSMAEPSEEDKTMDSSELLQIVCAVNRNNVSEEEFLADNVYYYNREENTVASLY